MSDAVKPPRSPLNYSLEMIVEAVITLLWALVVFVVLVMVGFIDISKAFESNPIIFITTFSISLSLSICGMFLSLLCKISRNLVEINDKLTPKE